MSAETQSATGVGWYEWLTEPGVETHIAYVQESGEVYLPEGGDASDFLLACARDRAWRLIRVVDCEAAREVPGE